MGGNEYDECNISFVGTKGATVFKDTVGTEEAVAVCIFLRLYALHSQRLPTMDPQGLGMRVKNLMDRMLRQEAVSLKDYVDGVLLNELGPELWVCGHFFMSKFPPTSKSKGHGTGVTFGTLVFACHRIHPHVYATIAAIKELESYATSLYTVKLTADFLADPNKFPAPRRVANRSPARRRAAQRLLFEQYTAYVPEY